MNDIDPHSSWEAVRDRMIRIIADGQPIGGVPEEMADKILHMLYEQETGKLCKLLGIPRAGVLRVWLDDEGRVSVLPVAYRESP